MISDKKMAKAFHRCFNRFRELSFTDFFNLDSLKENKKKLMKRATKFKDTDSIEQYELCLMEVMQKFAMNSIAQEILSESKVSKSIDQMNKELDELMESLSKATINLQEAGPGEWGGAGVIITSDPMRQGGEGDLIVCTKDAPAISWLIDELQEIYDPFLDFGNKYSFYKTIAEYAKGYIATHGDHDKSPKELLQFIVKGVIGSFRVEPLSPSLEDLIDDGTLQRQFLKQLLEIRFGNLPDWALDAIDFADHDDLELWKKGIKKAENLKSLITDKDSGNEFYPMEEINMPNSEENCTKMRGLSESFMHDLTNGFLNLITEQVRHDRDLILEIRNNYFNIYYKGQSLLKLSQVNGEKRYLANIHEKLDKGISGAICTSGQVDKFVDAISEIKKNINALSGKGKEIEFEQMIIRANNFEPKLRSDYLIIDRQIVIPGVKRRFDLTGIYLPLAPPWWRQKKVSLALFEIKFGIAELSIQLQEYYNIVSENIKRLSKETEIILKQKVELGLFPFEEGKLKALEEIKILPSIEDVKFVVLLVDYNPNSGRYKPELDKLRELKFSKQLSIFNMGFGLWEAYKLDLECQLS